MKKITAPIDSRGFTLIELLVVIALLGALVVGLLAAIDPVEQIKKGRDTALRNATANFFAAEQRQYANKGTYTWPTSSSFASNNVNAMGADVTALINAGELKTNFITQAGTTNLAKVLVSSTDPNLTVCFKPESKGFQADPATQYASDGGVPGSTCKSQTSSGGTDCFVCLR